MFNLSNRSKSRMAVAALELSDQDVQGLDVLVRETIAHPFIGPLLGFEAENLTQLIEEILCLMENDEPSVIMTDVVPLLANPKIRQLIAGGIISIVQQLPNGHQQSFRTLISRVSAMDIAEFKRPEGWKDEHHFLSEGLLPFIHATSDRDVVEPSCPHCGMFLHS